MQETKATLQSQYSEDIAKGYDNRKLIKQQITQIQDNLASLWSKVPSNKDTPGIIVRLYDLAIKDDIDINSDSGLITIGALENNTDYSSYTINMDIKGRHEAVYTFIYDVENLDRLLWLENADINVVESGVLGCKMTLRIFVLGQVKPDPQDYPFMLYERPGQPAYEMFQMAPGAENAGDVGSTGDSEPSNIPDSSYVEPDYSTDDGYTNPLLPQPGNPPAASNKLDIPAVPSTNPTMKINPN